MKISEAQKQFKENIIVSELADEAISAISIFAPNKNIYRHIPFITDGLLPSERRVLYAMYEDVKAFHRGIFERRFGGFVDGTLVDVYIDITGYKETYKRPEMLRLMRDCANGKVNLIFSETKGYLAANTREFCYWLHFIFNVEQRVDIITDDSDFNINTILNEEHQREALIKMAEDYIYLNPPDHQRWLSSVVSAIANLGEDG